MTINLNTQVSRTYPMRPIHPCNIIKWDEARHDVRRRAISTQLMHPVRLKNSVNRIYVDREEIVKLYLTTDFLILSIIRRPSIHNCHMWLHNMAYIEKLAESRTQIFSLTCQVLTAIIITTIRKRYGHSAHQIKVCSALPLSEKGYYV